MLFLVDQRLLHCNVMLKRTNLQSCPVRTCQTHKCKLARQTTLALPQVIKIFSKANTEINNFSDIVFFKRDTHPTWRDKKISLLAVNIILHCTFRFSVRTSIYKV